MWQKVSQTGQRKNNKCIIMHLLFLRSISERGGGAKWISGRWMNINNGVKRWEVAAFVRLCLTKTETTKGSNKRKSFVKPLGMNGSNFKNETLFVSPSHPFLVVMIAVKDTKSVPPTPHNLIVHATLSEIEVSRTSTSSCFFALILIYAENCIQMASPVFKRAAFLTRSIATRQSLIKNE